MTRFEPPISQLSCFGKCCKGFIYIFNIIFMLSGIAAAAVGFWAIADPTSMRVVILANTRMYITAAFILIGAGAMATIVAFIGCCAARYENRCLLVTYAVFLLLIFIADFAAGVLSLAFYTQVRTLANMEMRESVINKYGKGNHVAATDAWNYIQNKYDCCGFEGDGHNAAQLYQISSWFITSMLKVPPSCCKRDEKGDAINLQSCQSREDTDMTFVNNVGCRTVVIDQGIMFATVISGIGIAISLLQLVGMVFAFCLFRRL